MVVGVHEGGAAAAITFVHLPNANTCSPPFSQTMCGSMVAAGFGFAAFFAGGLHIALVNSARSSFPSASLSNLPINTFASRAVIGVPVAGLVSTPMSSSMVRVPDLSLSNTPNASAISSALEQACGVPVHLALHCPLGE